jgi:hypothetical protein
VSVDGDAGAGRGVSPATVVPDGGSAGGAAGTARYVFRVRFRLEPGPAEVSVDQATFETVMERAADPPGEPGWRFFRDNLWRGELNDEAHFRELTEEALDVSVDGVTFSQLRTDESYWAPLREAIAADLDAFAADTVDDVVSKYLGSSVRVVR